MIVLYICLHNFATSTLLIILITFYIHFRPFRRLTTPLTASTQLVSWLTIPCARWVILVSTGFVPCCSQPLPIPVASNAGCLVVVVFSRVQIQTALHSLHFRILLLDWDRFIRRTKLLIHFWSNKNILSFRIFQVLRTCTWYCYFFGMYPLFICNIKSVMAFQNCSIIR